MQNLLQIRGKFSDGGEYNQSFKYVSLGEWDGRPMVVFKGVVDDSVLALDAISGEVCEAGVFPSRNVRIYTSGIQFQLAVFEGLLANVKYSDTAIMLVNKKSADIQFIGAIDREDGTVTYPDESTSMWAPVLEHLRKCIAVSSISMHGCTFSAGMAFGGSWIHLIDADGNANLLWTFGKHSYTSAVEHVLAMGLVHTNVPVYRTEGLLRKLTELLRKDLGWVANKKVLDQRIHAKNGFEYRVDTVLDHDVRHITFSRKRGESLLEGVVYSASVQHSCTVGLFESTPLDTILMELLFTTQY